MRSRIILSLTIFIYFFQNIISCSCNLNNSANKPYCPDTVFISDLWKSSEIDRGRMINDLVNNNRLKFLRKDSVIKLLGTPSEEKNTFINYLIDMNCGKKKYGLMLFHVELDSVKNVVLDCWITD